MDASRLFKGEPTSSSAWSVSTPVTFCTFFFFHLLLLLSSVFYGVLSTQKAMQKPQDSTAVAMRTREIGTLIFVKHSSWDTRWRGSVGDRGKETIMPFFLFLFFVSSHVLPLLLVVRCIYLHVYSHLV